MQYSLLKSREYDVSCSSDGDGSDIRGYYGADNPRGLSLGANVLQAVLSETMVVEITTTGGVILLWIGLSMLEVKQVKVANFAGVVGSSFAGCIMGTVWNWFVERGSWRIRKQLNTSLERTPTVRALEWVVWGMGIGSMIESSGEHRSARSRLAAQAMRLR